MGRHAQQGTGNDDALQQALALLPVSNLSAKRRGFGDLRRGRLCPADGAPAEGVPVYFCLADGPGKKAKLSTRDALTNAEGEAEVQLKTDPTATGSYNITIEVADPERNLQARGVVVPAMAINVGGFLVL